MDRLQIIIDTREQSPWAFPRSCAHCRRATLDAGDYALEGDAGFAIERKSLPDFVSTIVSGRERFERELERMTSAGFPARVVIVEAGFIEILEAEYPNERVQPEFLVKRISELTLDGVSILFADNKFAAAGLCYHVLKERARSLGWLS